jgi:hypothetical protein
VRLVLARLDEHAENRGQRRSGDFVSHERDSFY